MADNTVKCPSCGFENEIGVEKCAQPYCGTTLPGVPFSELEYLRSIDASLKTIKSVAIFWVVLAIVGIALYLLVWSFSHPSAS